MKKIIFGIIIVFFITINITSAIKIRTNEWIPGACGREPVDKIKADGKEVANLYECEISTSGDNGSSTVIIKMLGEIIKYTTFIVGLLGVMFIVYNGILYSMGGADDSLKTKSKERIIKTLIGLIVLLLSGYILQLVAPWVYYAK